MYQLLIRLIFISAAIQLGLHLTDFVACRSNECRNRLEKAKHEILDVDWKPISVFPEKAKRFH